VTKVLPVTGWRVPTNDLYVAMCGETSAHEKRPDLTNTMIKKPLTTFSWLLLIAFSSPVLQAQESLLPVSRTAAVSSVTLATGQSTLVALPAATIVASGTVASLSGNDLTVVSSPSVLPALTGPHAIKITSKDDQRSTATNAYGLSSLITASTGQVVTAALPTPPNVGDEFVIYTVPTLSSVFGATNSAGLTGAAAPATADIVYVGSAGTLIGYFYNTTASEWKLVTAPTGASQAAASVGSTGGFLVVRKSGGTPVTLTISGNPLPGKQIASLGTGFQVVNNPFTASTTLAASGLQAVMTGGTASALADIVYLEVNGALVGYYYKTGGLGGVGWRSLADNVTDQAAVVVAAGKSLLIKKLSGSGSLVLQEPFAQ
jgi:hypothetical protein